MEYFEIERDIEDFLNNKIAVNCQTEEDAGEFLIFLASKYQTRWRFSNNDVINYTNWNDCENETCYNMDNIKLAYSNIHYYKTYNYKILIYKSTESKLNLNIKSGKKRRIIIFEENK